MTLKLPYQGFAQHFYQTRCKSEARRPKSWPFIVVKFAQNATLVLKCC